MSKAKQKSKKSKEATAQREDETGFMEDSADTSLKTGHSRSPGATGGEGSIQTSEVSGPGGGADMGGGSPGSSGPGGSDEMGSFSYGGRVYYMDGGLADLVDIYD